MHNPPDNDLFGPWINVLIDRVWTCTIYSFVPREWERKRGVEPVLHVKFRTKRKINNDKNVIGCNFIFQFKFEQKQQQKLKPHHISLAYLSLTQWDFDNDVRVCQKCIHKRYWSTKNIGFIQFWVICSQSVHSPQDPFFAFITHSQ